MKTKSAFFIIFALLLILACDKHEFKNPVDTEYRDYCYYTASGTVIYSVFSWIKTAIYNGKLGK